MKGSNEIVLTHDFYDKYAAQLKKWQAGDESEKQEAMHELKIMERSIGHSTAGGGNYKSALK